jgi:hypothetical protein
MYIYSNLCDHIDFIKICIKILIFTNKMQIGNKLWLLTGCFGSKMEQAMVEHYKESGAPYLRNRVFNNYSGMII